MQRVHMRFTLENCDPTYCYAERQRNDGSFTGRKGFYMQYPLDLAKFSVPEDQCERVFGELSQWPRGVPKAYVFEQTLG